MDTRAVTTRLPAELAARLDGLAERLDRPKGSIVKEAIASFISLEEKRYRLTLEALADVDSRKVVDHAEIEAWASGLTKKKGSPSAIVVTLQWTRSARADLVRLHEFLYPVNARAANRIARRLVAAARKIPAYPRLGTRLTEFDPREVRRVFADDYEIRYEVGEAGIFILRIFHAREDR